MSLDKAIISGKEKRRPYRGAKAVDCTCRNHGSCSYCQRSRTIQSIREEIRIQDLCDHYYDMQESLIKHQHTNSLNEHP